MIFTDLDGTLLNDSSKVSKTDYETIQKLNKLKIPVVAATGRSIYSAQLVLDDDFPIDYLAFSNGAGVMNWKTKEILMENHLSGLQIKKVANLLMGLNIDFSVHDPIPNNHCFAYWHSNNANHDFMQRISRYVGHKRRLDLSKEFTAGNTVLAIIKNDEALFEKVKNSLPNLEVIRTTSPIDNNSIWIEIFPKGVCKGSAVEWLCDYLNYPKSKCLCLGNDYNDLHMLEITKLSFVVENAPKSLKQKFNVVASNNNNGFTNAVQIYLKTFNI